MKTKPIPAIPSFLLAFTGLILSVIYGGLIWRGNPAVQIAGLVFIALCILSSVAWYARQRAFSAARTPLDWIIVAAGLVMLLSWFFSPAQRQGIGRLVLFLSYIWLFYFLLAAFQAGLNRRSVLLALIGASALIVIFAGLELYFSYYTWFQAVGSYQIFPPFPYRVNSLIGQANAYLAYANLCAPLVATGFFRTRSPVLRIGAGVWLAFFLLTLPFSSSRGGWLAFAVWSSLLIGKWLYDIRFHHRFWALVKRQPLPIAVGAAAALSLIATAGFRFYMVFINHPSHSMNLLGSRSSIWLSALDIWKSSPWIGAGIGRFGTEYFAAANVPPGFWAIHGHSILFQALAETGLAGLLVLLLFIGIGLRWLWHQYRTVLPEWSPWSWAILAALLGFLIANLVDDFSGWPNVMITLIVLVTWQLTAAAQTLPQRTPSHIRLLWLTGAVLIAAAGWNVWAYLPAAQAARIAPDSPRAAALLFDQSIRRDPAHALYHAQSGLAWAAEWGQSGSDLSLQQARSALRTSLSIEPAYSVYWANLAVLDWYAGDRAAAVRHIEAALQRSPNVPANHLMRGWFYEHSSSMPQAVQSYQQVLALAPAWSSHPFWQGNDGRRALVPPRASDQVVSLPAADPYAIALAEWEGSTAHARMLSVQLAEAGGDDTAILLAYEGVLDATALSLVTSGYGFNTPYATSPIDVVPGYMQLAPDQGQFAAMERLYQHYHQSGACQQAAQTWSILHRARSGGSLDEIPPIPPCQAHSSQP